VNGQLRRPTLGLHMRLEGHLGVATSSPHTPRAPSHPPPHRLLRWSFWRSFHRPQLNRTRPDWTESPPNLTWPDPT